jgi:hypothetical protein
VVLRRAADTACSTGGPVFPGVASPTEHHLGAVEVGVAIAGGPATTARGPVHVVDLPKTHIIAATSAILINGVGISTALVGHDALATALLPTGVFGAPGGNVNIGRVRSTGAAAA